MNFYFEKSDRKDCLLENYINILECFYLTVSDKENTNFRIEILGNLTCITNNGLSCYNRNEYKLFDNFYK